MTRNQVRNIFLSAFVLVSVLIAAASLPAAAQDSDQPYPTMAPVEQYLMDRDAEIALARNAAPDAISPAAAILRPPSPMMHRSASWPVPATKPQSKEKPAGSAGSDAAGWPCSITHNF